MYTPISDQLWGNAGYVPVPSSSPAPAASSSSWLGNLASAFAKPFISAGTSIVNSMPAVVESAGQGLTNVLMQRAGLIPKPQQQNAGTTVINYGRAEQGTTPPASINIVQPAAAPRESSGIAGFWPAGSSSSGGSGSAVLIVAGLAVVLMLFASRQ